MHADLDSLQKIFANALIDVSGIDPALVLFKGKPDINRERFALYRGNIRAIWQQSCDYAYPVLRQLLGADFFNDLTRAYGVAHPSLSGNLTEFGAAMPDFIDGVESCRPYPYLRDVAALEWLLHRSYYLQQDEAITLADLAAVPTEQLSDLRFQLQPNCFLMQSPWSIADIWQAHQTEEVIFPKDLAKKTYCLIWRLHSQVSWKVQLRELSAASFLALQALQAGETLGTALELALEADPDFSVLSELADWLHQHLIISITSNQATS